MEVTTVAIVTVLFFTVLNDARPPSPEDQLIKVKKSASCQAKEFF